jgi:hypothetical protein
MFLTKFLIRSKYVLKKIKFFTDNIQLSKKMGIASRAIIAEWDIKKNCELLESYIKS